MKWNCEICGKEIPATNKFSINYQGKSMIICGKHYAQYLKFGKFLDNSQRTIQDPNDYEITDDGVWIICRNTKGEISGKFLIDLADLEIVLTKKWRFWRGDFFTGNYKPIQIYRFLMQPNDDQVVDYINGNRWDNRRSNLRITTQQKNTINKEIQSNNKSGVAGVRWDKDRKKWAVEIRENGIKLHLGRYENLEDAVFIRYLAENILFGEYRSTRNDATILYYVDLCQRKPILEEMLYNFLKEKHLI